MKKMLLALAACGLMSTSVFAYDNFGGGYDNCGCDCSGDWNYQTEGFYIGALGGLNWADIDADHGIDLDTDTGWLVGGSIGYKFCNSMRAELEVAYRRNDLDKVKFNGASVDLKGHLSTTTVMVNALYDFDLGCNWEKWTPYVGVGIGYAHNDGKVSFSDGSRWENDDRFAVQAIVGIAYEIMCETDLGLEYRYLYPAKHVNDNAVALSVRRYF